jgi:hypothetical protein
MAKKAAPEARGGAPSGAPSDGARGGPGRRMAFWR